MRIMISGSIAYDNILSYNGRFSDHLVRESLDHINLTFVTESMTRNYGGCAANIAYALKLLGGDPVVTGAVGTDGSDYLYRFEELGIETSVAKFNDVFTAQCFVTTDTTGSQLATFNPGAMSRAHEAEFPAGDIGMALVAPDGKEAVIDKDLAAAILAKALGADMFIISTAVEKVALDYGKPTQRNIDEMTIADAEKYIGEKQFAPGSMLPKVQAIIDYVQSTGNIGMITDPEHLGEAVDGKGGTRIVR